MKVLVVLISCTYLLSLSVTAQRLYGESAMADYNTMVSLQEHLDTIRKLHGQDLQIDAYGYYKNYHDSLRIHYDSLGKMASMEVYSIGDSSVTYEGIITLEYHADRVVQMKKIASSPNYWNYRYEIHYNSLGLPIEVLRVNYSNHLIDTSTRYIFSYKDQLLITKTIQGWQEGKWINQDRTIFNYDSLGRKVGQGWQSTASTGEFTNLGHYPIIFSYDSAGRLERHYLLATDTLAQRYVLYRYFNDKLASEAFVYKDDSTSSVNLLSMYWYDTQVGHLQEVITGVVMNEVWGAVSRKLYYYYPNGLLKEYKELIKWPEEISWHYLNESKKYYYNRTE